MSIRSSASDRTVPADVPGPSANPGAAEDLESVRSRALLAEQRLLHASYFDPLTGLCNRRLLEGILIEEIGRSRRVGRLLGVVIVDVDRFRWLNDTLGQRSGDEVLRQVGSRISASLREGDLVGRTGSDEFTILVPGLRNSGDLDKPIDKIMTAMAAPLVVDGVEIHVGVSVGSALYPADGDDTAVLMQNADHALNRAKALGMRQRVRYTSDMGAFTRKQFRIENNLRRAIDGQELRLFYQPQVGTGSGELVGGEAMLRWQHPVEGLLGPSEFLSVAEQSDLIVSLGAWVLRNAAEQVVAWRRAGYPELAVYVNVSARQLTHSPLDATIERVLQETGLEPRLLRLEITESTLLHDTAATLAMMQRIREIGVEFALDDFGTGFSSLSCLQRFPISTVKIDRSFTYGVDGSRTQEHIVRAIVALGHALDMRVVAEGVETPTQLEILRVLGCDAAQGFLFDRPLPAGEFVRRWFRPSMSLRRARAQGQPRLHVIS